MQNYTVDPLPREFFILALLLLIFIFLWLIDLAFPRYFYQQKVKADYLRLSEREQYFRNLKDGKVKERAKNDKWRISGYNAVEFEEFLVSLWRESEYLYSKRLVQFHEWEKGWKFKVYRNGETSPTGEKMDAIEFNH